MTTIYRIYIIDLTIIVRKDSKYHLKKLHFIYIKNLLYPN